MKISVNKTKKSHFFSFFFQKKRVPKLLSEPRISSESKKFLVFLLRCKTIKI